jgi:hypothetical protein
MNHLKCVGSGLASVGLGTLLSVGSVPAPERVRTDHGRPQGDDPGWAVAPLWDDGRAELSTYVGTTRRYGETRPTRARIVLVKEDLVRATLVKSDVGPVPGRTVEVLKQVFVADFPTGTYAYHQTATLFFDRRTLQLLKEAMSHSESCGITFVRIGLDAGRLIHEAHSYWDGEADRRVPITWPAADRPRVLWDALPVWLRSLPQMDPRGEALQVWLLPTQISGRSPLASTRPVAATIRRGPGGPETVRVPFGAVSTIRYTVESPAGRDTFWLAAATPHTLIRVATAAGRRLELEKTQRLDYWNHHAVGDERLLR